MNSSVIAGDLNFEPDYSPFQAGLCCIGDGIEGGLTAYGASLSTGMIRNAVATEMAATSVANAQTECCKDWTDYLDMEVDVPAVPGPTFTDTGTGQVYQCPGSPAFSGTAATAAFISQQNATAAWTAAQQAAVAEQAAEWKSWLEYQTQYQAQTDLLYYAQAILAAGALYDGIVKYNEFLTDLNTMLDCNLANVQTSKALVEDGGTLMAAMLECNTNLNASVVDNLAMANTGAAHFCMKAEDLEGVWVNYEAIENTHAQDLALCMMNAITNMRDDAITLSTQAADYQTTYESFFQANMETTFPAIFEAAFCSAEDVCRLRDKLEECSDKYLMHHMNTHLANEEAYTPAVYEMAQAQVEKIDGCIDDLKDCAEDSKTTYDSVYSGAESAMSPVIMEMTQCMATSLCAMRDKMEANADDLDAHHQATYVPHENALMPAIMVMSQCMVERACEIRDWLQMCAETDRACYEQGYKPYEAPQAQAAMETAASAIPKMQESIDWFCNNAPVIRAIYDTCYAGGECSVAIAALECGAESAPEIKICVDWLKAHADDMQGFWDMCYRNPECAFVPKLITTACDLIDFAESQVMCLSEWSDEWQQLWEDCWKDAECTAAPIIIDCMVEAAQCLKSEADWFKERERDFWLKYAEHFCQCDIDDLQKVCNIWLKTNMMENICTNSECAKQLALCAQDAYETYGKPCELSYLLEVCAMEKYDPKYCDMTDRALMYIEKEFQLQEQELKDNADKHCAHAVNDLLCKLKIEKSKQIAAAISRANVIERHWEVSECNRRHQYHQDMFTNVVERWPGTVLQGVEQSNIGNDLLLARVHERIMRQTVQLDNMHQSGRLIVSGAANLLESGSRMIDAGHFWADLAVRSKEYTIKDSFDVMDDAQNLIQAGHYFTQQASNDKEVAARLSQEAVSVANRFVNSGHFHLQQARTEWLDAANIAVDAGRVGQGSAQLGHDVADRAARKATSALDASLRAAAAGSDAVDQGYRYRQLAAQKLNNALDASLRSLNPGIATAQLGLDHRDSHHRKLVDAVQAMFSANLAGDRAVSNGQAYANMGATKLTNAMNNAINGMNAAVAAAQIGLGVAQTGTSQYGLAQNAGTASMGQMMNLLQHGNGVSAECTKNATLCFEANKKLVECSKNFLNNFYCKTQDVMTNSMAAATATGQGLLATAGGQIDDAFGSLGSAVQGLINNDLTPPTSPPNIGNVPTVTQTTSGGTTTQPVGPVGTSGGDINIGYGPEYLPASI